MSPARSRSHLASPPPPDQLIGFPACGYPPGSEVFRSHLQDHEPCWFGSSGDARFDLVVPGGTCYTAESEVVALLETWGGMQIVPDYLVVHRDISRLEFRYEMRVADMTSNAAIRFGITAEVFSTGDYSLTQRWASALHQAGFAGIRYWARHDLAHTAACVALFGAAGVAAPDTAVARILSTDPLRERRDLLAELENQTGITVLPVPPI